MRAWIVWPALLSAGLCAGGPVHAAPPLEELAMCMAASATEEDRATLARWQFAALAAHPDLSHMASVSPEQRDRIDRALAAVIDRLLIERCGGLVGRLPPDRRADMLGPFFHALGGPAILSIMRHPDVHAVNQGVLRHLDYDALNRLDAPPER